MSITSVETINSKAWLDTWLYSVLNKQPAIQRKTHDDGDVVSIKITKRMLYHLTVDAYLNCESWDFANQTHKTIELITESIRCLSISS